MEGTQAGGGRFEVPDRAFSAARALDQLLSGVDGFRGMFWGERQVRGAWLRARVLSVHLEVPKTDGPGVVPPNIEDVATDVVVVAPRTQHFDTGTQVRARGITSSAITALAVDEQGVLGLLSGHATLPIRNGRIQCDDWLEAADPPRVTVTSAADRIAGRVEMGAVTPLLDYAVARFSDVSGADVLVGNRQSPNVIYLRTTPLPVGAVLRHFSPVRGRTVSGVVAQVPIIDGSTSRLVYVDGPEGIQLAYRDVIVARREHSGATPFSVSGDSGSLVFDEQGLALGTVLAGDGEDISYVLDVREYLQAALGNAYSFF